MAGIGAARSSQAWFERDEPCACFPLLRLLHAVFPKQNETRVSEGIELPQIPDLRVEGSAERGRLA